MLALILILLVIGFAIYSLKGNSSIPKRRNRFLEDDAFLSKEHEHDLNRILDSLKKEYEE